MYYVMCLEEIHLDGKLVFAYIKATSKVFYHKDIAKTYAATVAKSRKAFVLDVETWEDEIRNKLG